MRMTMMTFRIFTVCVLAAMCGCRQDTPQTEHKAQEKATAKGAVQSPRRKTLQTLPDGTRLPTDIRPLLELRKKDDKIAYLAAARDFLATNRNDFIAADVATLYAQMRMTNEFRLFGIEYAKNSPSTLLEFADIANNESCGAMRDEFALETAIKPDASYSELFRSARFLLQGERLDKVDELARRLTQIATKRYQLEDIQLMTCELAIKRHETSQALADMLAKLANDAMMPQVRQNAKKMLSEIKTKE